MESVQAVIEPDLLYPLLRGRDVKRWKAEPSAYILITHLPGMRLKAIAEDEMKTQYPKTYIYLKRFEGVLRRRAAFKRYFTKKNRGGHIIETAPFYSMFDIGDYTFAPYKVVWPWISIDVKAAVITTVDNKPICPEHNTSFVGCKEKNEAYFICTLLNSTIGDFSIRTFCSGGGGGIASPKVLQNIRIPKFNPQNSLHLKLAELSEKAHQSAEKDNQEEISRIEEEIDHKSAEIWGLTEEELKDIKVSLKELLG
ncbi:MAG: hypothetical protein COX43_00685 [Parcubacteria group bacterium CG23_combo_of_CG06-09_8_20_14_all_35_9]|nr:MAG: hypothetical protein COX43_00685 [Parcubacteria group bacterium CG23_combo_of_CG06-09_8_20_14_all_35_9]